MNKKTSFWRYVFAVLAGVFMQLIFALLHRYHHALVAHHSQEVQHLHPLTMTHRFSFLATILIIFESLVSGYAAGHIARARGVLIGILNVVALPILTILFFAGISVFSFIRAVQQPGNPAINGGDAAEVMVFSIAMLLFVLKRHWLSLCLNFLLSLVSSVSGSITAVRMQDRRPRHAEPIV